MRASAPRSDGLRRAGKRRAATQAARCADDAIGPFAAFDAADQLRLLDARCVGGEAAAASLGGGDSARCVSVSGLTAVAGTDAGGLAVWDLSLSAPGVIGKPAAGNGAAAFRWCAHAAPMCS